MRGFFVLRAALLAPWTETKEFQLVSDSLEAVTRRDSFLQFLGEAFLQFDNIRAARADKVVMMSVVALRQKLELGGAAAEVEALNHFHLFKQMHGPVDGGQIAVVELLLNLLDAQGPVVSPQDFQDRLPLAGDLAQFAPEPGS